MIGKTIGRYRIISLLGRGGMGEVYLADDTTLDRKVALKFLPEAFTSDPERMARFGREAKLLASLNHPNMAGIYGLERADGNRFLVLEYVEGETLQARLSKGALPLDESLEICRQIAEGLEAAHEKGVIHRDLKPANVMITAEEKVKILDFGLAKALLDETQSIDSSQSPTLTEAMTQPGVILGTAAYMSPEQAKGKSVDKRADIWAFGCILYECLTGKKAFEGETVTETLAAILKSEPDWTALQAAIPSNIQFVLRRCLEKDRYRRFRDSADVRIEIEETRDIGKIEKSVRQNPLRLAWAVAAFFIVAFAVVTFLHFSKNPDTQDRIVRLEMTIPKDVTMAPEGSHALSPDGRYLAFTVRDSNGMSNIWVRELDSNEARPLPGTKSNFIPPFFWSPDSRYIAFDHNRMLKKIDVSGGSALPLCDLPAVSAGGCWNSGGVIILGIIDLGIMRISAENQQGPFFIAEPNRSLGETVYMFPVFLPDGKHFIYFCFSSVPENNGFYIRSLNAGPEEKNPKKLLSTEFGGVYVPGQDSGFGHLFFIEDQTLISRKFDEKNLELAGEAKFVAGNVGSYLNYGFFSVSASGALVYLSSDSIQTSKLALFDREGNVIKELQEPGNFQALAISPNGDQAAFGLQKEKSDIWIWHFAQGNKSRFTSGSGMNDIPVWSFDGRNIYFRSTRDEGIFHIYRKPVIETKDAELFLKYGEGAAPMSVSSDGRFLLFQSSTPKTGDDLCLIPLKGEGEAKSLLNSEFRESDGRLSPDMRWIVYQSDESGANEVFVCGLSGTSPGEELEVGKKKMISSGGGTGPRWGRDGKELYYRAVNGSVMVVEVAGDRFSTPELLFPAAPLTNAWQFSNWDVNTDGQLFLLETPAANDTPSFNFILNWQSLLEK